MPRLNAMETESPEPANHIQLQLDDFENRWRFHPSAEVDPAVMPIAPLLEEAKQNGREFFLIALDKNLRPTAAELADLGAGA